MTKHTLSPAAKPAARRVLLVEDHPATRAGLAGCINAEPDMTVCGQAASRAEALELARALRPDAIILDLQLPDGSGWGLLEALRTAGELPPTLVFSVFDEALHAERLLRAGARGYLGKGTPLERIPPALRRMLAGRLVLSDTITTQLVEQALRSTGDSAASKEAKELQELSDRELQVLHMFSQGLGNKDIAGKMMLSAKTVGTYKARLMVKLGVSTAPELQEVARKMIASREAAG